MAENEDSESWPYNKGHVTVSKDFSKDYGEIWTFVDRTAGQSDQWPDKNFCNALAWIVQQLHLGNFDIQGEEDGEVVSVLIGRGAPFVFGFEDKTPEEVINEVKMQVKERSQAVNLGGIFARAREQGIEPKQEKLVEEVKKGAKIGYYSNTEIHYAFQLIRILKRIRERSFVLDSPPILGRASQRVVDLLGEATRCHLYGFHQACVAICRACLEKSLEERVPRSELLQERWNTKGGELECLVSASFRLGLLDGPHHVMADQVRKYGNNVLHRGLQVGDDSWDILLNTRGVVSYLFRDTEETRQ